MKKIGILGGLGPESTLVYYRGIIDAFKSTYEIAGYPEMIIESLNLKQVAAWAENGEWQRIADLISRCFTTMHSAGANFGVIASNTPHKVFRLIQRQTQLPLISIVSAARAYAQKNRLKKLLLLGTKFTMQGDFYQQEFTQQGMEIVTPDAREQDYIHKKIFSEITLGILNQSTKREMRKIINRHLLGVQGVILACTELPLILNSHDVQLACLDTTQIHINSITEYCRGK
ncbi:amino acid racemase [candidate division KSB1 bacterium]|nr:amino acid racemase [candidate division KSB1 bacterium]RQW02596.1 MAG: amino acid racemase [candidate division KSB1 bacterium]